jgi:hypothetical protein
MAINFPNSPSDGDTYEFNGTTYTYSAAKTAWKPTSAGGGGASVTVSNTAPSSPSDGDLWYDSSVLKLYVYYEDGSSSQWVQSNPGTQGPAGPAGADGADGADGSAQSYTNFAAFPSIGNTLGDLAAAQDTKALYMWDGTEWDRVSVGNDESPVILTEPPSSAILYSNGNVTTVTMEATDPEGFDITYGIAYNNAGSALPLQLASAPTISSNGVYTFTPSSNTSHAGTFKARLSASDGAKTTTRFTTLSLTFSEDVIFTSAEPGVSTTLTNTTTGWSQSSTTPGGNMAQSNTLQTGKRYFEMYITSDSGGPMIGIYPESNTDPGHNDSDGPAVYALNGTTYPTATFTASGIHPDASYPCTLMIAFDTDARKVWFGQDGSWGSGTGDPSSGVGYTVGGTGGFTLCLGNGTGTGQLTSNILLDSNLTYSIPSGFESQ